MTRAGGRSRVPGMTQPNIGPRVKKIRLKRGLTHEQLAAAVGLTRTAISYIEAKGSTSLAVLYRLADALGVRPGDLLR